jgi:hypothetical protein
MEYRQDLIHNKLTMHSRLLESATQEENVRLFTPSVYLGGMKNQSLST